MIIRKISDQSEIGRALKNATRWQAMLRWLLLLTNYAAAGVIVIGILRNSTAVIWGLAAALFALNSLLLILLKEAKAEVIELLEANKKEKVRQAAERNARERLEAEGTKAAPRTRRRTSVQALETEVSPGRVRPGIPTPVPPESACHVRQWPIAAGMRDGSPRLANRKRRARDSGPVV